VLPHRAEAAGPEERVQDADRRPLAAAVISQLTGQAEGVLSIDADGERRVSDEEAIALAAVEPAIANEVLSRGQVQSGPAAGDHAQVREGLRRDTVVVIAPIRLVARARSGVAGPYQPRTLHHQRLEDPRL